MPPSRPAPLLLFDRSRRLFGKHCEVRTATTATPNIGSASPAAAHGGLWRPGILTSNHKAALDPAFQRQLRFVVHFPFPEMAQRKGHLARRV